VNPTTALLIGLGISILQFLGTMLWISSQFGEYKNKVDTIPGVVNDLKATVTNTHGTIHQRLDFFWKALSEQNGEIGRVQGQLERINGKQH
jgi:hypothetical protein